MKQISITAIIEKEDNMYVALCPEFDIASQGNTIEEAKSNLTEAIILFLETADKAEIKMRYREPAYVTQLNIEYA